MKRNPIKINSGSIAPKVLLNRTVYHEAGHSAAIYLYNKRKQLPPVFFQININQLESLHNNGPMESPYYADNDCIATVEGGRLLQSLPVSTAELINDRSYLTAFEADIVNLLVGPIAEAKYVALCDDEPFHLQLLNFNALRHYGGASDIEAANEYLECFFKHKTQRLIKANQLFIQAFRFIEDPSNWQAVECLADYILTNRKKTIHCEEIMSVLDEAVTRQHTQQNIAYAYAR